ncbi:hypothetical protein CQW23_28576 [Capsicum baccatum]|uniref:Cytochrome n=1 Tax=Capsicum baccatum TaxID=33114 RepID=A0A2G2VH17_CAPBA|nr:hypothetical protein CQW23_28576 [Capsicum baccatum]
MRSQQLEFMMKSLKNEAQDGLVVDLRTKSFSLNSNMTCLMGLTRCLKDLSKVFDEFNEKIIDEHVQSHEQKQSKDFVFTTLDIMQLGKTEFQFDHSHIKAILFDMFVAGIDTSATTIDWILTELLRHPHVMKKLQKELEEVVGLER